MEKELPKSKVYAKEKIVKNLDKGTVLAIIDVGSHAISMYITELRNDKEPIIIEKVERILPIGMDTYKTGIISLAILEICQEVLKNFKRKLKEYKIEEVYAYAGSAFREAKNRAFVLDQIKRNCRIQIEILPNSIERFYHLIAIAEKVENFNQLIKERTMLIDIGSGSIQVIIYDEGKLLYSGNVMLGALRIREILSDLDRHIINMNDIMSEYIASNFSYNLSHELRDTKYKNLIIVGADTKYLKYLINPKGEGTARVDKKQIIKLLSQLEKQKHYDTSLKLGITEEHASLLLPETIIIKQVLEYTEMTHLIMPEATLCEGIIYNLVSKKYNYGLKHQIEKDLIEVARQLGRKFRVNKEHQRFIEEKALQLFDQLKKIHRLGKRERTYLQISAILHDFGRFITVSKDWVAGAEIVLKTELLGFTPEENAILAKIVGFEFEAMSIFRPLKNVNVKDQVMIIKLAFLIHLAECLDFSHNQRVHIRSVKIKKEKVTINISSKDSLALEIWQLKKLSEPFRYIFGIELQINEIYDPNFLGKI